MGWALPFSAPERKFRAHSAIGEKLFLPEAKPSQADRHSGTARRTRDPER
jgi:hypothetical protein